MDRTIAPFDNGEVTEEDDGSVECATCQDAITKGLMFTFGITSICLPCARAIVEAIKDCGGE